MLGIVTARVTAIIFSVLILESPYASHVFFHQCIEKQLVVNFYRHNRLKDFLTDLCLLCLLVHSFFFLGRVKSDGCDTDNSWRTVMYER